MLLQQSQTTVADIFGHRYQLSVSSYGRPSAGSARRFADVESATQFLRSLRTSPESWRRLLSSIGEPITTHTDTSTVRACAALAARGRIRFYPVPQTNTACAITAEPGWAYAFASADQSGADSPGQLISVTDAADAEVLVSRLSPSTSWANILYKAGLQNRISADAPAANRGQVVQALAEQKLIVYKTRHQSSPIAKPSGDSAPAAGPGVRPVPLAPESLPKAVAAKPLEGDAIAGPQSLAEAEQLLAQRRQQIIDKGYQQKYNEEQLAEIAATGEVNDRFLVRLIFGDETKAKESSLGFKRDSGRAPYWATTLDMAESADTDPEILAGLFGIENFNPSQPFTLAIIDTAKMPPQAERESFIPTFDRMREFGEKELTAKEGIGPGAMEAIMDEALAEEYALFMSDFEKTGKSIHNSDAVQEHSEVYSDREETQRLLQARHRVQKELGANPLYSGNGLTKVNPKSRYAKDIGQEHGVVETFTFERDPLTIADLDAAGAVKLISATPIKA